MLNATNYRSNKNGRVFRDNLWKPLLKSSVIVEVWVFERIPISDIKMSVRIMFYVQ